MTTMLGAERRKQLVQLVHGEGVAQVGELARRLKVSPSTIRRDLTDLQSEGLLARTHGGAVAPEGTEEPVRQLRSKAFSMEKQRLGRAAAAHVAPGSTIMVTGGTTTQAMTAFLVDVPELTVVTNSLTIAVALSEHEQVDVVVLGGYLRHSEMSLLGHLTREALDELSVDMAFVGTYGVDRRGLTGAHVEEADTDRFLLRSAAKVAVLADSSKFGVRGPVRIAGPERMTYLFTDVDAPADEVAALREAGVTVVQV
ncbi:DeoR/GlpR transcriptional regulator [Kitasatospora sp. NA04385]|uniref:DeoR/GlpR family DNA-binding transcription regulator n=1 Tax=Kitasatospora sp. NA04385 TaxID=2742135 RepID=UPI00159095AD|nr:DeoR/GlpR family DNA-binding transcription regulator [Kitasatospora sp. NA04385]QKW17767.1 DeoR/GlpR transcriptional regulator [Kitasatospora sp. NA04385]